MKNIEDIKELVTVNIENLDSNLSSRCPATRLAINRTARVIGRIKFLTVSMITIKDIRAIGVPIGVKCAKKLFTLDIVATTTLVIHSVTESVALIDMCEVLEKMKGNKDRKFI